MYRPDSFKSLVVIAPFHLAIASLSIVWPRVYFAVFFTVLILFFVPQLLVWFLPEHGTCVTPAAHQAPFKDETLTFFAPGLGASWMQALGYTGPKGLSGSSIDNAPLLLTNVHPINPPEVETSRLGLVAWIYTAIFTGIGRAWHRVRGGEEYAINIPRVNFAQDDDIQTFLTEIRVRPNPKGQIILAGASRGAAVVLGAVTHMTAEEQARVAFVLLEGIFDSVPSICRARYGPLAPLVPSVLSWFTAYDPDYPSPLEMAKCFPRHVPVAIVTSEVDTHVPMLNTLAVRDAILTARDFRSDDVETLVLAKSHHSFYMNDNVDDQRRYRELMEALHARYC